MINNFYKIIPFLPKEEGINNGINKSLVMTSDFSFTDNQLKCNIWARLVSDNTLYSFINCAIDERLLTNQELLFIKTRVNDSWYWHESYFKNAKEMKIIHSSITKSANRSYSVSSDAIRPVNAFVDCGSDLLKFSFSTIDLRPIRDIKIPNIILFESDVEVINSELMQFKNLINEALEYVSSSLTD